MFLNIMNINGLNKKRTRISCPSKLFQQDYLYLGSSETDNFFLPFALLAANTLRPFGVDILSRKPCLFLLLR